MTTHVFIVDSTTFKYHLEYLFAGTGAKDYYIDFNNSNNSDLHPTRENMLVGMMADGCRIRRDDQIIFYLQQDFKRGIYEGKFYGVFTAQSETSFLDNNDGDQYLGNELKKSLTFRILIEPNKVYSEGVTEWEALDEIKHINNPNQMLWSLIYRKLKGNRGNTMVTIYEAERLCQLIRNKNLKQELIIDNHRLTFDIESQKIVVSDSTIENYNGRRENINILTRLIKKYTSGQAFEIHLQWYIVNNLGKNINTTLDNIILGKNAIIEWLGNEVSCGVGMQRIDILVSTYVNGQRVLTPIELKSVEAEAINSKQIQRYVDWIEQYYTPNRQSDIKPVIISKKIMNKNLPKYNDILTSFNEFNSRNYLRCSKLQWIEYYKKNEELFFELVNY